MYNFILDSLRNINKNLTLENSINKSIYNKIIFHRHGFRGNHVRRACALLRLACEPKRAGMCAEGGEEGQAHPYRIQRARTDYHRR